MLIHFQFYILTNLFSQLSISFYSKNQNLENLFRWWKTWTKISKFMKISSFWLFWKCTLNMNTTFWTREKTFSSANSYCDSIWQKCSICLRNPEFFMLFQKSFDCHPWFRICFCSMLKSSFLICDCCHNFYIYNFDNF